MNSRTPPLTLPIALAVFLFGSSLFAAPLAGFPGLTVGTSGTAVVLGRGWVVASHLRASGTLPGFHGDYLPNAAYADNGHDDGPLLRKLLARGNVNLFVDRSFMYDYLVLWSGDHIWLAPWVIARKMSSKTGPAIWPISNQHMNFVNYSGSNGFTVPNGAVIHTGTSHDDAGGYGDSNIGIGGGIWDFNTANQPKRLAWSRYTLPPEEGGDTGANDDSSLFFSGVDGIQIGGTSAHTILTSLNFISACFGNDRNVAVSNTEITDKNLSFPGRIPGLTAPSNNTLGDGLHFKGGNTHVRIDNYTRLYGGDIVLQIGDGGDGRGCLSNHTHDNAIWWWWNAGDDSDFVVNRITTNGGGIGIFGETAGIVTSTAMWTGTLHYTTGQTFVPQITTQVHDVTINDFHVENVDSLDSGYVHKENYAQINEGYCDPPISGHPSPQYDIRINRVTLDPLTEVPQCIQVSGSNWTISGLDIPLLNGFGGRHKRVIAQTQGSPNTVISGVRIGGVANTGGSTDIGLVSPGGFSPNMQIIGCSGTGLNYIVVGPVYGTIRGSGNNFPGLTGYFDIPANQALYGAGQFAPPLRPPLPPVTGTSLP
jgi:hypothetical protein